MSVIQKIKNLVTASESLETYRCNDCGATFEGHGDPDSYWFSCEKCDSGDIEPADQ